MTPGDGALLLLPTLLGASAPQQVLPEGTLALARETTLFLAENARSARAFLKTIAHPMPIGDLGITEIGHAPNPDLFDDWLAPVRAGRKVALLSEAGCPAVADPGAGIVMHAHRSGLRVRPLVGPSSLLLCLMASGMDGQRFRFVGYLPQDRHALAVAIGELERASGGEETQLFIETPYRNERLLQALLDHARPDTRLAVAADLTTVAEQIISLPISTWKAMTGPSRPVLAKRPAVFALMSSPPAQAGGASSRRGRTSRSGRQ